MAKAGIPFVVGAIVVAAIFFAVWCGLRWEAFRVLGVLALVFAAFSAFFFRDPERTIPQEPKLVVAPADGKIIEIVTEDNKYVGPNAKRVTIFLSVFDVHVNRIPISGNVTAVEYNPGKFLMAWHEKASADNEQTHIAIESPFGTIAFKQIAGWVARRIVCDIKPGDAVTTGARMGLIRFGSRADIIFPPDAEIHVQPGERARGGETVIGVLP